MLVLWSLQKRMHRRTAQCRNGAEKKRRRLATGGDRSVTSRAFSAYGHPLEMVTSFRYLKQVISEADDNWLAVVSNLSWVRAM